MTHDRVIFVTGGAGFIGGAFLREYVEVHKGYLFVNIDDMRAGSNQLSIAALPNNENYAFEKVALEDAEAVADLFARYNPTDIIHFAADSDVDNSILNPRESLASNIVGTFNLLEGTRKQKGFQRFVYVSTDEVYGSLTNTDRSRVETDILNPRNPYSASKAAAEHMVRSYGNTYGLFTVITRGTNTYGPWQKPTKLIPKAVMHIVGGLKVPVYGDGMQRREWMHVSAHISGIRFAWLRGERDEVYNIGTNKDIANYDLLWNLINTVKRSESPEAYMEFVTDRPGHDRRYSINASKIQKMGWTPPNTQAAFEDTIEWYVGYWGRAEAIVK